MLSRFLLRIPHPLMNSVERQAKIEHKSRNTLIREILEEALLSDRKEYLKQLASDQ